jgi:hypothetical protein
MHKLAKAIADQIAAKTDYPLVEACPVSPTSPCVIVGEPRWYGEGFIGGTMATLPLTILSPFPDPQQEYRTYREAVMAAVKAQPYEFLEEHLEAHLVEVRDLATTRERILHAVQTRATCVFKLYDFSDIDRLE